MKKILISILIAVMCTACSTTNDKKENMQASNIIGAISKVAKQENDKLKDTKSKDAEKEQKENEVTNNEGNIVDQRGSNDISGVPNSGKSTTGISSSNNESSSNSGNTASNRCPADNEYKFFYTNENGEFATCPGSKDPVPEPPKPTYACEFAKFDKNMPCDWIPPNQEEYDYGPFKNLNELWADSEGRGLKGPQTHIKYIYDNVNVEYLVYSIIYK